MRIALKPMFCKLNKSFMEKWYSVLNKYSLDLILLIVEELFNILRILEEETQIQPPIDHWSRVKQQYQHNQQRAQEDKNLPKRLFFSYKSSGQQSTRKGVQKNKEESKRQSKKKTGGTSVARQRPTNKHLQS